MSVSLVRYTVCALLGAVALAGCDDASPDGAGGSSASSTAITGTTATGATSSAAAGGCSFVGSCRPDSGMACYDYGGAIDAAGTEAACESQGNQTWSTAKCSTAASVGGCQYQSGPSCTTIWYFAPVTSDSAMSSCQQGGGVFMPAG